MDVSKLEFSVKKKKLEMKIKKAITAKDELELKKLEAQLQIQRYEEHALLQDEEIEKAKAELAQMKDQ